MHHDESKRCELSSLLYDNVPSSLHKSGWNIKKDNIYSGNKIKFLTHYLKDKYFLTVKIFLKC